jgi:hypothetical protein
MSDLNIFSLNKFRKIKLNYYNNKNECLKNNRKYGENYITNPQFKTFDQTYFHAGDQNDINKYGLLPLRYYYSIEEGKDGKKESIFKLYKNIDYNSVKNTFDYIFYKFKKGIFIIIRDNKLVLYLPFSNANYKNNWYKNIYFNDEEKRLIESSNDYSSIKHVLNKNIIEFQKKYPEQFSRRKLNFNREEWYANNCIFRNEYPKYEGELNINVYKNMIDQLVAEREVNDVEFFINDRDFPLLKKDLSEPYNHIFNSESFLVEEQFRFKKMCPLFSKSITDSYADLLIPTNDDWVMASNKYFLSDCSDAYHKKEWDKIIVDWKKKKDLCIFRGSATGCGITLENNMRLKASDMSIDYPELLDAGITDWKARMRKYSGKGIEIINTNGFRFKLANKINNIEKSEYKYILNIDGYVSAYRLSSELSMGSVVLIVKSDYKLWFSDKLIEYVHYVPVNSDLSDLIDIIKWCKKNDKKCKEIAHNGMEFFKKYLSKDGILDYMSDKLKMISSNRKSDNLLDIKKSKKRVALITIFRDNGDGERLREKNIFVELMSAIMVKYCDFKIYIIEQSDDGEKFNIGKLKNIGFHIANKDSDFDNYIFSDIDTLPDYDLMEYFFIKMKYPISLAIRGTRYESKKKNNSVEKLFLGGLVGFDSKVFTKINGYPNNFWGWGGEDDSLIIRLLKCGITKVYYPKKGSIIDIEEEKMKRIGLSNKLKIIDKEEIKYEKLYTDMELWKENGLNNLEYKILERKEIEKNIYIIKVDLMSKSDIKKNPKLYNSYNGSNETAKKLYSIVVEERKTLNIEYI